MVIIFSNAVETVNKTELEIKYLFIESKSYCCFKSGFLKRMQVKQEETTRTMINLSEVEPMPSEGDISRLPSNMPFGYSDIDMSVSDGMSPTDAYSLTTHLTAESLNYDLVYE